MSKRLMALTSLLFATQLMAQTDSTSLPNRTAEGKAIEAYHHNRSLATALYTGIAEEGYLPDMKGDAFFKGNEWQKGDVFFDGVLYTGVLMKYDLVRDQLLVQNTRNHTALYPYSPAVGYFSFSHYRFTQITNKESRIMEPGFYEILASGPMTVWCHHRKKIREQIYNLTIERDFEEKNQYYVRVNEKEYHVTSQQEILKLAGTHKKDITHAWKQAHVKFKKDQEQALIIAAAQYNQLTN